MVGFVRTSSDYETIRNQAHDDARRLSIESHFADQGLIVTSINQETLDLTKGWPTFNWSSLMKRKFCTHLRRFEVSIWYESYLCGLAVGKVSKGNSWVRIDNVEKMPGEGNPLKGSIFPISFVAATKYAGLLGKQKILVTSPINQELIDYYCGFGGEYLSVKAKPYRLPFSCVLFDLTD
ncbi:MAG: hypothetical protein ABW149_00005 [Sedimenticola sp.]